jgi:hypothetical protein
MAIFSPNCTLPPEVVSWVSPPNIRGTWDIFWAAITTLFLCTWSVQHPNLPGFISTNSLRGKLAKLFKRLALMLVTLIVPEFLLLKAIGDFSSSRSLTAQMTWRAQQDQSIWSIAHSYLLNMGGIVVLFDEHLLDSANRVTSTPRNLTREIINVPKPSPDEDTIPDNAKIEESRNHIEPPSSQPDLGCWVPSPTKTEPPRTNIEKSPVTVIAPGTFDRRNSLPPQKSPTSHRVHLLRLVAVRGRGLPKLDEKNTALVRAALAVMKENIECGVYDYRAFVDINNIAINLVRLRERKWALDGAQFILAREQGLIASIPNITEEEIDDKSNGDSLAKFLACVQVGWQIVQLLIRWGKHLPASQLEVVTVAYSLLTFFIYIMNWSKPQDVDTPCIVSALRYPTIEELIALAEVGPSYVAGAFAGFEYAIPEHAVHSNFEKGDRMDGGVSSWLGGIGGGLIFGALHCAAWNFNFPSTVESLLWKISSLITTGIPLIYGTRAALMPWLESTENRQRWSLVEDTLIPSTGILVTILYIFSRCFILVETFRSLFFLVPDAFQS